MAKVSIAVPSRNEKLLAQTVEDIFAKATGDIEVIVVLDGPTDYAIPLERVGLTLLRKPVAEGLKPAINDASKVATGKYLMKTDAHCMFGEGFDEILQADCEDNWVTTARRFTLIPHLWEPKPHPGVDYYYLGCPWTDPLRLLRSRHWKSKSSHLRHVLIDDQMCIHGSMWLMPLDHFRSRIGLYDNRFGSFAGEPEEIEMKTWLGGGRVIINKKTWYAHLHTVMRDKGYVFPQKEVQDRRELMTRYWTTNKWEGRIYDFDWLIEKFWGLPNWPKNWREFYEEGLLDDDTL
jgi:glycosyltransferase involved in cell wall biosynthesis